MKNLDYLSFTVRAETNNSNVVRRELEGFLDIDWSILECLNGIQCYSFRLRSSEVTICYGGQMGIHVQLSATQLKELSDRGVLSKILNYVYLNDIKVTRIDLCIDFEKEFSYFLNKVRKGYIKTKAKKINYILDNDDRGTIYVGSKKSNVFTRIYDKGLEQGIDKTWTRVEVQLKQDKCDKRVLQALVENDSESIKKIMNGIFHITDSKGVFICKTYYSLINTRLVIKLKVEKKERNFLVWWNSVVLPQIKKFKEEYTNIDLDLMLSNPQVKKGKTNFFSKYKKYQDKILNFDFWEDEQWLLEDGSWAV